MGMMPAAFWLYDKVGAMGKCIRCGKGVTSRLHKTELILKARALKWSGPPLDGKKYN